MSALFGQKWHCFVCGEPVLSGALVCSCGAADFSKGGTRPTVERSGDSYPLPWPWDGLEAFPAGTVVALTGGPGSGKSTLAAALDPATWASTEQTPRHVGTFFRRLRRPVPLVFPCSSPEHARAALRETPRGLFVLDSLTKIGGWMEQTAVLATITEWARSAPERWGLVILQVNARGEAAGMVELPHMVDAFTSVEADGFGLRTIAAAKNRNGRLFSRLFGIEARGVVPLEGLADRASYSVEGSPGAYSLHPWPMPGAKWAGLLDKKRPDAGYASAAVLAPSYLRRGVLEPADVAERRLYAEAHGLVWLEPFELRADPPPAKPRTARKGRKTAE